MQKMLNFKCYLGCIFKAMWFFQHVCGFVKFMKHKIHFFSQKKLLFAKKGFLIVCFTLFFLFKVFFSVRRCTKTFVEKNWQEILWWTNPLLISYNRGGGKERPKSQMLDNQVSVTHKYERDVSKYHQPPVIPL